MKPSIFLGIITGVALATSCGTNTDMLNKVYPQIAVSPASIDLGDTPVGVLKKQSVEVTNDGAGPLTVTSIALRTGAGVSSSPDLSLSIVDSLPADLATGEKLAFDVQHVPRDESLDMGVARIESNDLTRSTVDVLIMQSAIGAPKVFAVPDVDRADAEADTSGGISTTIESIDFGTIDSGTRSAKHLFIVNGGTGNIPLIIEGFELLDATPGLTASSSLDPATEHVLLPLLGSKSKTALTRSMNLDVAWQPPAPALYVSTVLRIRTNDTTRPTLDIPIVAGTPPVPVFPLLRLDPPDGLAFDTITVGRSKQLSFTVYNDGDGALLLDPFALTSTSTALSLVDAPAPITVLPQQSASFAVSFAPASSGLYEGSIRIASNDRARPQIDYPLAGTAVSTTWVEIGASNPIIDKDGNAGALVRVTFSDTTQPDLLAGLICDAAVTWGKCRPATSSDRGATWTLFDSPVFDAIEANNWTGWWPAVAVRSPANARRIYFAANGHPWLSTEPRGGLWRSDDDGANWTANLMEGQPGESGMIPIVVADRDDPDRVYINRGYDYGNVSTSTDAGAHFTIICGHNNVAKTGSDAACGMAQATLALDLEAQRVFFKHHFQDVGVALNTDGTGMTSYPFAALGVSSSPGLGIFEYQFDTPIRGLANRAGGRAVRYDAGGTSIIYLDGSFALWQSAPDFSAGAPVQGISPGGSMIILTHPIDACTWLVQSGPITFEKTTDCGMSWAPVPTDGLPATAVAISAVQVPDGSGVVLLLMQDGRRFIGSP